MTSLWSESMLVLFAILVLGYFAGTVSVHGISLGASGVLFVALVCGYFGAQVPKEIMDLGLTLFVYCVGIQAGPMFFRNFRRSGWQFSVVAVAVVVAGAAAAVAVSYFMHIPHDIATGLYAGGLTNTPALAGAMEIAERLIPGSSGNVSAGFGIAYPYSMISVVLVIQFLPKLLRRDVAAEEAAWTARHKVQQAPLLARQSSANDRLNEEDNGAAIRTGDQRSLEDMNMLPFLIGLALGCLLGAWRIPLGRGIFIKLGSAGGAFIVSVILGSFGRIGRLRLVVPVIVRKFSMEFGLMLFLAGAGTLAGSRIVSALQSQGWSLVLGGAIITTFSVAIGLGTMVVLFRMDTLSVMGALAAAMTNPPGLGVANAQTETDIATLAYASVYPIALILKIIIAEIMVTVLSR
jgi:putative transport protein